MKTTSRTWRRAFCWVSSRAAASVKLYGRIGGKCAEGPESRKEQSRWRVSEQHAIRVPDLFVSTVVCSKWKGTRRGCTGLDDCVPGRAGEIFSGPTAPEPRVESEAAIKDPKRDEHEHLILSAAVARAARLRRYGTGRGSKAPFNSEPLSRCHWRCSCHDWRTLSKEPLIAS